MTEISQDYIMRIVEQVSIVISKALGYKNEAMFEQAHDTIDQGISQLLGHQADLFSLLDSITIARLMGDHRVVSAYAHLLREKALLIVQDKEESDWLSDRSIELVAEAESMKYQASIR